jgi:hypothetical protein
MTSTGVTVIRKTILGTIALAGLGLIVMAADPTPSSVTAAGVTLTSVSVILPGSDRLFPNGPGAMQTNANCLTCHSAGMVMNQPNLTKAAWQGEVMKMIKEFQAPIAAGDIQPIVNYLATIKGKP